jgi:hypothetical protein
MNVRSRLLLAVLASASLLAVLVGASAGNRLAMSETGFRVTFSPLSFIPSFGSTVRCPVTLHGSFHSRTVTKTNGALIGYVNAASVTTCEAGRLRFNAETLPWHIQYNSFGGTLPSVTSITISIIRPSFEVQGEIFGIRVTCRYTTTTQSYILAREATRGVITQFVPGSESTSSETGGCPSGRASAVGNALTPAGAAITLSLV